MDKSVP
jgi:5'-AMP-activated protein kinase, catalytic alpha subunit